VVASRERLQLGNKQAEHRLQRGVPGPEPASAVVDVARAHMRRI